MVTRPATGQQKIRARHQEGGHQVKQSKAGTWGTNVSTSLGNYVTLHGSEVAEQGWQLALAKLRGHVLLRGQSR